MGRWARVRLDFRVSLHSPLRCVPDRTDPSRRLRRPLISYRPGRVNDPALPDGGQAVGKAVVKSACLIGKGWAVVVFTDLKLAVWY